MDPIELDATVDGILLIPQKAALDVHILKAECILGSDQCWQRAYLYVEIAFNELQITLRKGPVDVFHRVCGREEGYSDSWQVVGTALQIKLPPSGGLLDKDLSIANIPVRRRVACNVISLCQTHAAQNTRQSHRLEGPPAGTLSGTWKAFKTSRSLNASLIRYTCTKDSFSAETPLGERYTAKFDGQFYPVEDDPGHTMVSAKLLDARTVELTSKRNGKIVSVSRLSVAPDGNSIHAVFENKESGGKTAFDFEKQK